MKIEEKYYIATLGNIKSLGSKSIAQLVKYFGSAKTTWNADAVDLWNSGVRENTLETLITWRKKYPDAPEKLISYCDRQKINLCSIVDEDYPPILKEIDSPPMFFYYRGSLEPLAERIGIVGTRRNTAYGQGVALELGEELAAAGLTVVSGAARGIDTFAHQGALKSGRTVAVLGCGINYFSSPDNKKFLEQISERGVVLSEFPPQMKPNQGTFPQRNRIIAGLCKGIIVVEAKPKSGTLCTANYASKYNRDCFCVEQNIDKSMFVCATMINNAQDVLKKYH